MSKTEGSRNRIPLYAMKLGTIDAHRFQKNLRTTLSNMLIKYHTCYFCTCTLKKLDSNKKLVVIKAS